MKKLLSTIMAVVMLLSLMPMAVAEEGVTAKMLWRRSVTSIIRHWRMLCSKWLMATPLRC